MSRIYCHQRNQYTSTAHDGASLIWIILLAGTVWAHRVILQRAMPVIMAGLLVMIGLMITTRSVKLIRRISRWRLSHNPTMAAVDRMTGLEFEKYIATLLKLQSYSHVTLTEEYDLGVDIIAHKDGVRWGIQVKCYSGLVKAEAVRQVVTALKHYKCDQAMVVTNNVFSVTARKLAVSNGCLLVDRDGLLQWLAASSK